MRRGEAIFSRRGMSPLIATVLLMAFAVALGGMIMNWKFTISVNGDCEALSEQIKVTQFCMEQENIVLRAQSGEDTPTIQGIRLNVISGNIENTLNVKNSELQPGQELRLSIPVRVSGDASVELIGSVGPKGDPLYCDDAPIERVDPIQPC